MGQIAFWNSKNEDLRRVAFAQAKGLENILFARVKPKDGRAYQRNKRT